MQAVDHGVYAEGEEVLVVVRIDVGGDGGAVGIGFTRFLDVDLEDTGEPYFELDGAVLVEAVVPDVLYESIMGLMC